MMYDSPFVPLLLVTLLAVAVPVLVSRIRPVRLPIVVGEILAGMLIGQSGLNLVRPMPTLAFLAGFGFTFLMFLSGLEVSLDTLFAATGGADKRPHWQRPLTLAAITFLLTVLLAVMIGLGLSSLGLARNSILLGLILSTTSLGIVVPVLKERGLTATPYGQLLLVTALISDFVTLLLLSLAIAVTSHGFSLNMLLFMLLLVVFVVVAKISQQISRLPVLTRITEELAHATAQIRVRGAFALMVAWVVLSEALGVEVILGAFLAGALVSLSSQDHESPLREKLDAIGYGFFIPIFFIMVGVNFDLRVLFASPAALALVPLLIIAAYMVKLLPALLFRPLFSWRETLAAGTLLSSRLSLIIAASAIALELGMITIATNSAIILVAVVTCTLSPILFSRILPVSPDKRREGIIILGTGQLAVLLGRRLRQAGESVTFIGRDDAQLEHLRREGLQAVLANPDHAQTLAQAGSSTARALIAVSNDPAAVLEACHLARERFQIPILIARADDPQLIRELQGLEVRVIQPTMATALALEGALHFPAAFNMLMDKTDDVELADVPLRNQALAGRSLRQVRLPGNVLVMGIRRQGEVLVPHGDTVLRRGDTMMLVGSPDSLREACLWLSEHLDVKPKDQKVSQG
jgi:Kef-type K+ transport system membrane component KefB/Trk K+ transport system NAD-binding subunit